MTRLFGFIGNRSDFGSRVLDVESEALRTRTRGTRVGWGVGYYQAGEVLLRRRPTDERLEMDIAGLTRDVRTDALVGSVGELSFGEPCTENTQPFRYRNWLFVHGGTVAKFERLRDRLVSTIPDFLRGNLHGETDSELLFHLYLSFLHDEGTLNRETTPASCKNALRSTLSLIDSLSREEGAPDAGPLGMMVSNGEYLASLARDLPMAYRTIDGSHDIDALLPDDGLRSRRLPDLALVRFSILASGIDAQRPGWQSVPDRSIIVADRLRPPSHETF